MNQQQKSFLPEGKKKRKGQREIQCLAQGEIYSFGSSEKEVVEMSKFFKLAKHLLKRPKVVT